MQKPVTRRCTKIKAGEQIELAGGIVVKNPSPFGVRLVIETPITLTTHTANAEAQGHDNKKIS